MMDPIAIKLKLVHALDNLELNCVSSQLKSELTHKHFHEDPCFAIITGGKGIFRVKDQPQYVEKGTIFMLSPGEVHTSGIALGEEELTYRAFYVSSKLIQDILYEEGNHIAQSFFFKEHLSHDSPFSTTILATHIHLFETDQLLAQQSLFRELIWKVIDHFTAYPLKMRQDDLAPAYLPLLIDYLRAYYKEQVSLEDLAQLAHRSQSQVLRAFKKYVGISPHAFVINLRINQAKKLLLAGMPIAQIAYELGFADQSHLHRYFKRYYYVAPGKFIQAFSP